MEDLHLETYMSDFLNVKDFDISAQVQPETGMIGPLSNHR